MGPVPSTIAQCRLRKFALDRLHKKITNLDVMHGLFILVIYASKISTQVSCVVCQNAKTSTLPVK